MGKFVPAGKTEGIAEQEVRRRLSTLLELAISIGRREGLLAGNGAMKDKTDADGAQSDSETRTNA